MRCKVIDLLEYGYKPGYEYGNYLPARITAVHRERYEIVCNKGFLYAKLKTGVYYPEGKEAEELFPTVGDFVLILFNELGDSLIVKTLERKSIFERKDPKSKLHRSVESNTSQAVAANFDYVFIVSSLNYDLNQSRLERYLTLSWQSGAIPVIVLTKEDLKEEYQEDLKNVQKIAGTAMVHVVSSKTGYGMDELNAYFKPGKTVVFLGSSGVGKSSLVNSIAGYEMMKVNGIRENDSKGRHTTTHRQLIKLDSGAMVIDTPGMRELGMWEVDEGIKETFGEIEELTGKCKFSNCTHTNEPGCAIRNAIEMGILSEDRWISYKKILEDAVVISKQDRAREGKEIGRQMKKFKKESRKQGKFRR